MNSPAHAIDPKWNSLFKIGGTAALLMVAITISQFIIFIIAQPPVDGTAIDWFTLFQKNAFQGLLGFEFLLVIYALLSILVSVALFAVLKSANHSLAVLFLVLSAIGGMAFILARPALEMLSLSNQYAAATTEVQRTTLLAAGEVMVAFFHGTAFQVSYFLGSISGLIIAIVMLRSKIFSKTTAWLRIGSSIFDFGLFIPGIGLFISLLSVVFLLVFNIMVALKLLQVGNQWIKNCKRIN